MNPISRRALLKRLVAAGAANALASKAEAREKVEPHPGAVGMLYDSTRCVGCLACVAACKEANALPLEAKDDPPRMLGNNTKNVVKTVDAEGGKAFMKRQCMHCVDPSCVSVCMLGALHKEGEGKRDMGGEHKGTGIVLYDKSICVGCRYCQIACAFNVPKFEWGSPFPKIVKCEMCRGRADPSKEGPLALANPACAEVCPNEAVVYGRRADLLLEAKRRIAADPAAYNPSVFGEKDGGGTQVLYLARAGDSFGKLGFPDLPKGSSAQFSESVSHAPYLHGVTPLALYAVAAIIVGRNRARQQAAERSEQGRTGQDQNDTGEERHS
jgi:Fe-S-cluster-containing dehydrogenase component